MDGWDTNRAGQFQINLPAGSYYLIAVNEWEYHGLVNEVWDNVKCSRDCDPLMVGTILIEVPENHSILADFVLDPEVIFKHGFE